eukprot:3413662-Prymnesium_polylepis.1
MQRSRQRPPTASPIICAISGRRLAAAAPLSSLTPSRYAAERGTTPDGASFETGGAARAARARVRLAVAAMGRVRKAGAGARPGSKCGRRDGRGKGSSQPDVPPSTGFEKRTRGWPEECEARAQGWRGGRD